MNTVEIQLFGSFHRCKIPGDLVVLPLTSACTAQELKTQLFEHLNVLAPGVVAKDVCLTSALATAQKILSPNDSVQPGDALAILPPVCGG